ncbi:MAG: CRTAC1 family protein [Thermoanaerobaculia bacterium]
MSCSDPEEQLGGTPSSSGSRIALSTERRADRLSPRSDVFIERALELGLDFVHFNGMTGEYYMAEVTGSGAALFDYDNDGDLDIYLVQGNLLGPGKSMSDALFPYLGESPPRDRLFRNDLEELTDGSITLTFTDVTAESGIDATGYGMGVATGDYDNDGWTDLYVTNYGNNQLWHNNGDLTFSNVTTTAGVDDPKWSVPATFFDFDQDGWQDLFIGNYIAARYEHRPTCRDFIGAQDYCGPGTFDPLPDRLLHNLGDGTFEDVTQAAGLSHGFGGALGVVTADFNGDGLPDIYVANDALPNNLWINQGDGTFRDEALLAGCAVNGRGKAEASMGVDVADFDADGDPDLIMAHLTGETNTLYQNDGKGNFEDFTIESALGPPSRLFTAFGIGWFDYDNDSRLDLLVVNGAVKKIEALARVQDPYPLHQTNQLFRYVGSRKYQEVTSEAGEVFQLSEVSRGAAFGDIDNDGDTDILISNNNGPVRLLINEVGNRTAWLGIRALGSKSGSDALGARIVALRKGSPPLWRRVETEGSFCAANDPRALFGLGTNDEIDSIQIYWPDGTAEEWTDVATGDYTTLRQGTGRAISSNRSSKVDDS